MTQKAKNRYDAAFGCLLAEQDSSTGGRKYPDHDRANPIGYAPTISIAEGRGNPLWLP